jgi:general secretion pathway protein G
MAVQREDKAMKGREGRRGTILVELLLVSTVTALVAGACAWKWGERAEATRMRVAKSQIMEFCKALWLYYADTGRLPAGSEGLVVLVENPGAAGWRGPYLEAGQLPRDPWGRDYGYLCLDTRDGCYHILSAGPDGRYKTEDDIGITVGASGKERPAPKLLLAGRCGRSPVNS